jgi:hypothetical protein
MMEGSEADPYLVLMDPEGSKSFGSGSVSGYATLLVLIMMEKLSFNREF